MAKDLDKAAKRYEEFTGHKAKTFYEAPLDDKPVTGYRLGSMVGVAYEATRDGKTDQYFHRFAKKARPDLVARDDGKRLYVVGGDYKVTDRGIEDMAVPLFVVNPSSRKRRKGRRKSSYKANPMAHRRRRRTSHRRRRSSAVTVFASNPVRRRRRRSVTRYRANPIRRHHRRRSYSLRRYRRNPSGGSKGFFNVTRLLIPAATVGAAAVGVEIAMGYLPIPLSLKSGPVRNVTKAALAIGAGLLVAKFASKRWGEAIALGGVTIAVHDMIKDAIASNMPGVQFGASPSDVELLGYSGVGPLAGVGEYVSMGEGVGEYVYT